MKATLNSLLKTGFKLEKHDESGETKLSAYNKASGVDVGFVAFRFTEDRQVSVRSIEVKKEFRNQGFGSIILDELKDYVAENGLTQINVKLISQNLDDKPGFERFLSGNGFSCSKNYYGSALEDSEWVPREIEHADLLENYTSLPLEVQKLLDEYSARIESATEDKYQVCEDILKSMNACGYTFDYGLDGEICDLQVIEDMSSEDDDLLKTASPLLSI